MRVLVTGALGFVGNAVCWQLAKQAGHDVVALSSRPGTLSKVTGVETVHADLRDRDAVRQIVDHVRPAGVCHLAALTRVRDSFDQPLEYFDANVGGTVTLLDALAAGPPVPVVFMSTGAVYGQCDGRVTEGEPRRPTNPYGASKAAAEDVMAHQAATEAIGVAILRCFNVAGGWQFASDVALHEGQELLIITSTIYRPYQHLDALRALGPYGVTIETVGVPSSPQDRPGYPPSAYLQELRSTIRAGRALLATAADR
jgi:nucleoside-diphosphate-sugar epimerase